MYVMMYVMEYITITEFRKNTKVILDAAENGPVMLRRGDELYELKKFGNVLHTNTVSSNVRPNIAPINIGAPDFGEAAMAEATPHSQVKEKLSAPKDDVFVPRPPDPETGYPCCQQNKPCKHWQWDTSTGEGYVNTLTGKVKEVL